ncbi:CDP-alcohol phosphatidyltransferase family protein [Mycetocola spongiae]|uniref:CDP-alcohol phosphatidyltransferase family protein n=1 Tax=Mycetocola spongiae TaxID=2859226 RepID=UPI001CF12D4D|nr:CDP-alcohol phosphatidyltransferase family protein [Mycetocola spongiae]UCR89082.1 CDP-alcohol phosphatidyltransferase family protein [Mycetocola spongiae]
MSETDNRPAKPRTIAELRAVAQPPEVRSRRNAEHWTASLYLRDLSPYLTWLLLRTRISANGVTGLMILTGWSIAGFLLIPGIWGALLGLLAGQAQMLVDCSDGEVARWRRTSSPAGAFLDAVGHYSTETLIPLALAIRAAGYPFEAPADYLYTTLGALLAIVIILNKALNDMVRVARANYGASKLTYSEAESAPRPGLLQLARRIAKFLPFHRMFHSVELTMVIFVGAVVGLFIGDTLAMRWTLVLLLIMGFITLCGHFVAIMTSQRVRA